jgi:hypothetical protein
MSFTVDDFEDLLRLLYERPEWQERLRRVILPPELFELPRLAQELADVNRAERERIARLEAEQQATRQEVREGFEQTGKRLDRLDGRVERLDTRVAGVEGRVERVETDLAAFRVDVDERFDGVDKRFDGVDKRFDRLDGRIQQLSTDLGTFKGIGMEERLRRRIPQFRHLVPEPVDLTPAEVAALLDGEVAAGRLAAGEARQVERSDLILRSSTSRESPYLLLEVSWLVDERDVRRAHDRAALLRKAGYDARAAVAGIRIQPDAVALAGRLGVERMIDEEDEADEPPFTSAGDGGSS